MVQSREEWRKEAFAELFEALALEWKETLNLPHWTLHWEMAEPIDEDDGKVEGQCTVRTELGYQAWITLADRLVDADSAEYREHTIVHELLHIKHDELFQFLSHYLDEQHHAYFRRLLEIVVDDLATILVDLAKKARSDEKKRDEGEEEVF